MWEENKYDPYQIFIKSYRDSIHKALPSELEQRRAALLERLKAYKLKKEKETMNRNQMFIGSLDSMGNFSASAKPALHTDMDKVRAEAERLARLTPGKKFVVVQVVGVVEVAAVKWQ